MRWDGRRSRMFGCRVNCWATQVSIILVMPQTKQGGIYARILSKKNSVKITILIRIIWTQMPVTNLLSFQCLTDPKDVKEHVDDIEFEFGLEDFFLWASCQIRKLRVLHVPGMPGTFSPPIDFKGNRYLQAKVSANVRLFGGDSSHTPFFDWQSVQETLCIP